VTLRVALLVASMAVLSGCRTQILPRVSGGATATTIPAGPVAHLRAPENPAQASSQTVTRVVRTVIPVDTRVPTHLSNESAPPEPAPISPSAPVRLFEQEETVVTTIGPTQDVAGVVREAGKALRSHWRILAAVLSGLVAAFVGGILVRKDWSWVGLALIAGGLGSILSGTFWGVGIGAGAATLLTLGYLKRFLTP
jgi:hypothetical protein